VEVIPSQLAQVEWHGWQIEEISTVLLLQMQVVSLKTLLYEASQPVQLVALVTQVKHRL